MSSDAPENSQQPPAEPNGHLEAAVPELPAERLPSRKDTSLREFLNKIDDFAPIVRFIAINGNLISRRCPIC